MKRFISFYLLFAAFFAVLLVSFNVVFGKVSELKMSSRNVAVNRINAELSEAMRESGSEPAEIIAEHKADWSRRFGKDMPRQIVFIPAEGSTGSFLNTADKNCAVCCVYDSSGRLTGIAEYTYDNSIHSWMRTAGNIFLVICFLLVSAVFLYLCAAILAPFRRLSDYPERLARLRDIQKLPESRSRFFGKYIWGMNMLSDILAASSRRIHTLEGERQKLVSTIAHGVKTPVANIRLYTDAVRTGLYSDEGMTDDIADKIDRNTVKIEKLAAELMSAQYSSLDGFDIEKSPFAVKELADLIRSEFIDRMELKRIPFTVECRSEGMLVSDKYALYRAVSQLLENAVKYGDGGGIRVELMRHDDGFSISVRNRGELLPEKELPYVFRSYWRGSNAAPEGSGIGLYVVHETVKALGGTVYARRIEETSEMEFVIFLSM
ncbi:sensor histidine kinase KdpD [uncultured Ruminococcus sp.]|uniref:sensor histidine kinase n=1 Tax=uncultured Ruminococcus sp. TaxID=165186 RepID=UPI0026310BCE|nr:HAMP domain-containing sensor histidine kinase [uncultured Ruminococcus sp.]